MKDKHARKVIDALTEVVANNVKLMDLHTQRIKVLEQQVNNLIKKQ